MKEFNATLTKDEFEKVFQDTVSMIEDAFAHSPGYEWVEAHIKGSSLSHEDWSRIITKEPPYYLFYDRNILFVKTPDKKIEIASDFLKRLETGVIKSSGTIQTLKSELKRFDDMTGWQYIKIGFKKLFKRKQK